jgi:hypothetical protein
MGFFRPTYVGEVKASAELARVVGLPRRHRPPEGYEGLTEVLMQPRGAMALRDIQAQALAELYVLDGLLALIRVGAGKTLITYLAPTMVDAKRPILLVPAKLREKTYRDFEELEVDWKPGPAIKVVGYELLGRLQSADLLEELQPDLIMADEAHYLKNCKAAVTKRVGRYMDAHPATKFVGLSGTMTKRSIFDFAHIAEWCLGESAPVPLQWRDLDQWSRAIDEDSVYPEWYHAGALKQLCPEGVDWAKLVVEYGNERKAAREVFRDRLVTTPGVVATKETPIDASLVIEPWLDEHVMNEDVQRATEGLYKLWVTPDGIPLDSPVAVWRYARELALGFYYRWVPEPPKEWLTARKVWSAFVRERLGRSSSLDSPSQVAAMFKGTPELVAWEAVKDTYEYDLVPVWLDYSVVEKAAVWAQKESGIVWVEHRTVGQQLENQGLPYYGNLGLRNGHPIEKAMGGVAASIAANKEGRNLQHYHRNLVLTPPTTGAAWEQMLGRTHRDGQKADEVTMGVYTGCLESHRAVWQAVSDAKFQQGVTGSPQKLTAATITVARPG